LLAAARDLLEETNPSDVSLAAICGKAGLVKSAVYRYFESREDILAEVLLEDLKAFQMEFRETMKTVEPDDIRMVAHKFAEITASRLRMASLNSQMASILERNISSERLFTVKLQMLELFGGWVETLAIALPSFGPEKSRDAAQMLYLQISAFYSVSNPDQKIAKVLERPELVTFKTDFQTELERACRAILLGISSDEFEN